MRYLKKFNESEELYRKSSIEDVKKLISNNQPMQLSMSEVNKIDNIIHRYVDGLSNKNNIDVIYNQYPAIENAARYPEDLGRFIRSGRNWSLYAIKQQTSVIELSIDKFDDEWYLLQQSYNHQ